MFTTKMRGVLTKTLFRHGGIGRVMTLPHQAFRHFTLNNINNGSLNAIERDTTQQLKQEIEEGPKNVEGNPPRPRLTRKSKNLSLMQLMLAAHKYRGPWLKLRRMKRSRYQRKP